MLEMTITGNVGQDAVTREKKDGGTFVNFSVGVSVSKDKSEWINVICSNEKQSQTALNYIKKGMKILVRGYPTINCYNDKNTNQLVKSFTLSAHMFEFLSSRKDAAETANSNHELPARDDTSEYDKIGDNDIPF